MSPNNDKKREKKEEFPYHIADRRHFIIGYTSHDAVVIWVAGNKYFKKVIVSLTAKTVGSTVGAANDHKTVKGNSVSLDTSSESTTDPHKHGLIVSTEQCLGRSEDFTKPVYFNNLSPNTEYQVDVEFIKTKFTGVLRLFKGIKNCVSKPPKPIDVNRFYISLKDCITNTPKPVDVNRLYKSLKICVSKNPRPIDVNELLKRLKDCKTKDHSVNGRFRTFPNQIEAPNDNDFCFLVGSCNLSTITINHLVSEGIGSAGLLLANNTFKGRADSVVTKCQSVLWYFRFIPRIFLFVIHIIIKSTTKFKQPKNLFLVSPFERLNKLQERSKDVKENTKTDSGEDDNLQIGKGRISQRETGKRILNSRFMMHIGDQIYFDVVLSRKKVKEYEYWNNYKYAWFHDECMRKFLQGIPNFMIPDDHEFINEFDGRPQFDNHRREGLEAYYRYVHCRNIPLERDSSDPKKVSFRGSEAKFCFSQEPWKHGFYFSFSYGAVEYFVLDTRSGRNTDQIISEEQMDRLLAWMKKHKSSLKFIITSVPFIAEMLYDKKREYLNQSRQDKWSGDRYISQKRRIISAIYKNKIKKTVFLVGDVHCSYHATLDIEPDVAGKKSDEYLEKLPERITLHELSCSPIYQVQLGNKDKFASKYQSFVDNGKSKYKCNMKMHQIESLANSIMSICVRFQKSDEPIIDWRLIRTLANEPRPQPQESITDSDKKQTGSQYQPISGRISFS